MSDLMTYLRLVVTGTSSEAVAAVQEVDAATFKLGEAQKKANAEQTVMAKSGHNGLLLMAGGAGLVTAAVLGTVDAYARQAEAALQVEKLTGMNAKQASDFVVQSQAMGISADSLGTILGRMSKNVVGYMDGSTSATSAMGKAFEMAGISVDSLKGMNAGQVIDDIREKIAAMPAGLERSDVIQSIFGKGAAGNPDLLRFLTATQSQLDSINKTASQFGLVFSQHDLDNATKYGEEMRMLKIEFEGISVSIGKELAPDLAAAGKAVGDLLRAFNAVPNSIKPILMLTPGFLMMGVGIYKVEQATVGLSKAGYSAIQMVRAFITSRRAATVATTEATTATEGSTVAEEAATGAEAGMAAGLYALLIPIAAVAAALVALLAIYEAVKAASEMFAAQAQERAAEQGAKQADAQGLAKVNAWKQAHPGQALPPDVQALLTLVTGGQAQGYASNITAGRGTKIGKAADGALVKAISGGSLWNVGEGGQDEVIATVRQLQAAAVSPSGGGGSGAPAAGGSGVTLVMNFSGAVFNGGPSGDIARQWAKALAPEMAEELGRMLYTTSHTAKH